MAATSTLSRGRVLVSGARLARRAVAAAERAGQSRRLPSRRLQLLAERDRGHYPGLRHPGNLGHAAYIGEQTFKPNTSGLLFQIDGTASGGRGSPNGPRFNDRVGTQYTLYSAFAGARNTFDGARANASDNNTFLVFTWLAY